MKYKDFEEVILNYKTQNNSFLLYTVPKPPYYKKQKKFWKDKFKNILEWLKLIISFALLFIQASEFIKRTLSKLFSF